MTKIVLLERFRDFTLDATRDLIMPVRQQREDEEPPEPRAAKVYLMRLPEFSDATKKAPYILHQIITGKDAQAAGEKTPSAVAVVRTVFCVYSEDEQEGGLLLLNLMERLRIALLVQAVIGNQFVLDLAAGLETLVYPDGEERSTAPYYLGEMISTWKLPAIERKIQLW